MGLRQPQGFQNLVAWGLALFLSLRVHGHEYSYLCTGDNGVRLLVDPAFLRVVRQAQWKAVACKATRLCLMGDATCPSM